MAGTGSGRSTTAHAEKWAARVPIPVYAVDDEPAIKMLDGAVEVVSEEHWKRYERRCLPRHHALHIAQPAPPQPIVQAEEDVRGLRPPPVIRQ